MTKHFVEVIDPYERYRNRRKKRKLTNYRNVVIGNEPYCDYTYDEWVNMMEYYNEYENPSKNR